MAFAEWFVAPPLVGGPNQYGVVEATSQAEATKLKAEGYGTPYSSKAAATAAASAATKEATSTETDLTVSGSLLGTLAQFLGVSKISGTNLMVRAVKVIVGGIMLIVGLAHMTGAANDLAAAARKVPLPI